MSEKRSSPGAAGEMLGVSSVLVAALLRDVIFRSIRPIKERAVERGATDGTHEEIKKEN